MPSLLSLWDAGAPVFHSSTSSCFCQWQLWRTTQGIDDLGTKETEDTEVSPDISAGQSLVTWHTDCLAAVSLLLSSPLQNL